MSRPLIVLVPGLALTLPAYEVLRRAFERHYRAETKGYVPPGVGPRFHDKEPTRPGDMAAELLASLSADEGQRVYVGHSAGAHVARAAAMIDRKASALVLLDPNLGDSGRYDPQDFDVPTHLSGWAELEAIYRKAGIRSEHVAREWWQERPDGTLERAFNLETIRAQIAAMQHGLAILDEFCRLSDRLPVAVVRTAATSVNPDAAWERLKVAAPEVKILELEVHHALPFGEQLAVATTIIDWIDAL